VTTVEFCRINRRTRVPTLQMNPFAADMAALAEQGMDLLEATVRRSLFIAADLTITSDGNYMTGTLGFAEEEILRTFDRTAHSWLKADVANVEGATLQTVVPFAVDLREKRRWAAFATTGRIRATLFRQAFEATLNAAVIRLGLMPTGWEVDPVMSVGALADWLAEHEEVFKIVRRVKLTNPSKEVDEVRRKLLRLGGSVWNDSITAPRNEVLETDNEEFRNHVKDIETGDSVVELRARAGQGEARFKSIDHREFTTVASYGQNLDIGMDRVLSVLVDFSEARGDVEHDEDDPSEG